MKIILAIFLSASLCAFACGEQRNKTEVVESTMVNENAGAAEITFDTLVKDIGIVREGERIIAWFDYKNSGTRPLIVNDIKAGCGCTVPQWNEQPLIPGEGETIKIIFDSSGKMGIQNIKISVYSNAKNSMEELQVKAIVKSIN